MVDRAEGKLLNREEGNGKPPRLSFPRHDMTATFTAANGVNGITDPELEEPRPAEDGARHLRSSSREILATRKKPLRVATWNVRTLYREGKLENLKREMTRLKINIMGVSETRWTGQGDFYSDGFRVIHSGGNEHQKGVAVVLDKQTAKTVERICYEDERLMLVKLKGKPSNMIIIQVYMPTTSHDKEEIELMYGKIEELLDRETKGRDYTIIMGDWNAVVGEKREGNIVGDYGLGTRNQRGDQLVEFCQRRRMYISNTWFKQEKRRRYTWTKPGNTGRYQIDYILIKSRYWNSVSNCKSYPGADVDSDHNPVVATVGIQLNKSSRKREGRS